MGTVVVARAIDNTNTPYLTGAANILVNGGLEIWQRGTGFSSPGNGSQTADGITVNKNGAPTFSASREASVVDGGVYSFKLSVTVADSLKLYFTWAIENTAAYRGKTVSVSVRVNSNVANTVRIGLADGITNGGAYALSSYHTGDGTWQTLTVTATIAAGATNMNVGFGCFANGDIKVANSYFDSAMMVLGPNPVGFIPLHPADDWARCLRYYEAGTLDSLKPMWANNVNAVYAYWMRDFRVMKSVVPTVTVTKPSPTIYLDNLAPNYTGGTNGSYTPIASANFTASAGAVTTGSFSATLANTSITLNNSNMIESGITWTADTLS